MQTRQIQYSICTMQAHVQLSSYGIKSRLQGLWRDAHSTDSRPSQHNKKQRLKLNSNTETASEDALADSHMQNVTDKSLCFTDAQQAAVFAVINSYTDLFLPNQPYPIR